MQSAPCCTNCRVKYSILNPEEGCSSCAFSFCRKCLLHRVILPQSADKPMTVCSQCYEKINAQTKKNQEGNGAQITRIRVGDVPDPQQPCRSTTSSANWWGDGLPPPSLRQTKSSIPPSRVVYEKISRCGKRKKDELKDVEDIEKKWSDFRKDDTSGRVLSLTEIEQRLANLRGCDVEVIRNPRCILEPAKKPSPPASTAQHLIEEAKSLAEIEEKYDPYRELEQRFKRIKEEDVQESKRAVATEEGDELTLDLSQGPRLSTVSSVTAFSEATAKELEDINRLLEEAEKRVKANEADDKLVQREMKSVSAATRQKSLELEKVGKEMEHFWDRQLNKIELSESDGSDVDDEAVKKILFEVEQTVPEAIDSHQDKAPAPPLSALSPSQRRPGLFSKIFRR